MWDAATNTCAEKKMSVGFGRRSLSFFFSPLNFPSKPLQCGIALHQLRLRVAVAKVNASIHTLLKAWRFDSRT
jgi:hypothetical protein